MAINIDAVPWPDTGQVILPVESLQNWQAGNDGIRLTVPQTRQTYVCLARHYASFLTGSNCRLMSVGFRLTADYDI